MVFSHLFQTKNVVLSESSCNTNILMNEIKKTVAERHDVMMQPFYKITKQNVELLDLHCIDVEKVKFCHAQATKTTILPSQHGVYPVIKEMVSKQSNLSKTAFKDFVSRMATQPKFTEEEAFLKAVKMFSKDNIHGGSNQLYFENLDLELTKLSTNHDPIYDLTQINDGLRQLLTPENAHISGIDTVTAYMGYTHTMSVLHVEDFKLGSLNVLYKNSAPKVWFGFSNDDHHAVTQYLQHWTEFKCVSPLLHKDFIIDIETMAKVSNKVYYLVQFPGDIVVTNPGGVHQVVNLGFNYADATNFYSQLVLPKILGTKTCSCRTRLYDKIYPFDLVDGAFTYVEYETLKNFYGDNDSTTKKPNLKKNSKTSSLAQLAVNSMKEKQHAHFNEKVEPYLKFFAAQSKQRFLPVAIFSNDTEATRIESLEAELKKIISSSSATFILPNEQTSIEETSTITNMLHETTVKGSQSQETEITKSSTSTSMLPLTQTKQHSSKETPRCESLEAELISIMSCSSATSKLPIEQTPIEETSTITNMLHETTVNSSQFQEAEITKSSTSTSMLPLTQTKQHSSKAVTVSSDDFNEGTRLINSMPPCLSSITANQKKAAKRKNLTRRYVTSQQSRRKAVKKYDAKNKDKKKKQGVLSIYFKRQIQYSQKKLKTAWRKLQSNTDKFVLYQTKVLTAQAEIDELMYNRKLLHAVTMMANNNHGQIYELIAAHYTPRLLVAHFVDFHERNTMDLFKECLVAAKLDHNFITRVTSSQEAFDREFCVDREGRIPANERDKHFKWNPF